MKHYLIVFFSFLKNYWKGILVILFSFILGMLCCFFVLSTIVSGILNKDRELHSNNRLVISSDVLLALNHKDYGMVKGIMERELLSELMSVTARARLKETDYELNDKILQKAYFAFCTMDKEMLLHGNFESEEKRKSYISLIESIDAFFNTKGYAHPLEK